MDSRVLDVLPVQAAFVPEVLLKLLLNESNHGQPAGVWRGDAQSEVTGQAAGRGEPGLGSVK